MSSSPEGSPQDAERGRYLNLKHKQRDSSATRAAKEAKRISQSNTV